MNVIHGAIRQPVTVTVGVILIILAGVVSLARIPIQLTPNVESTVITVSTFWEGASPEEIEQNVVDKQEERLIGLACTACEQATVVRTAIRDTTAATPALVARQRALSGQ